MNEIIIDEISYYGYTDQNTHKQKKSASRKYRLDFFSHSYPYRTEHKQKFYSKLRKHATSKSIGRDQPDS